MELYVVFGYFFKKLIDGANELIHLHMLSCTKSFVELAGVRIGDYYYRIILINIPLI